MSILATCSDCEKKFRVPHAQREWHCKVCEGVLVLDPEEAAESTSATAAPPGTTCAECGAENEFGANFCEECGEPLGARSDLHAARRKRTDKEVSSELRRAYGTIKRLQNFLRVIIALRVMGLALAVLAVFGAMAIGGGEMLPAIVGLLVIGLDLCLLLVLLHQLRRRPFPAALTLAIFSTVTAVLELVQSDLTGGQLATVAAIALVFPAAYWFVTMRAATLSRLIKEHPDQFLSRRLRGEHDGRRAKGGSVRQRVDARAKKESKPPYIAIGVVLTVVLGIAGYGWWKRPTPPDDTLRQVGEAWNAQDYDRLGTFVAPDQRAKFVRSVGKIQEIYDWGDAWPEAVEYSYDLDGEIVRARLSTVAGDVPFRMSWESGAGWTLDRMSFHEVKTWKR